jgi:hypothetical protein
VAGFPQKIIVSLILMVSYCMMPPICSPEVVRSGSPVEYKIKAAFLLNFAKFITWPDQTFTSPQQPFSFCVLGQDPFGTALTPMQCI